MKVVITGVNGFIGKAVAEFLFDAGNEIYGIDFGAAYQGNSPISYFSCD